MIIDSNGINIDYYDIYKIRECKECNCSYNIVKVSQTYFERPWDYSSGFQNFCLDCWLVGNDDGKSTENIFNTIPIEFNPYFPSDHEHWYDTFDVDKIVNGDLKLAYKNYIKNDCHIVVLPISRLHVDTTIFLPFGMLIYPQDVIKFENFKFDDSSIFNEHEMHTYKNEELVRLQSFLSNITIEHYKYETLIVLPIKFEWESIYKCTHNDHMDFIKRLSDVIDEIGFKYLKYKYCKLDYNLETKLPSFAGQFSSNYKMSSCLLINGKNDELKLIGGNAFSQYFISGVGLKINQPEWDHFPKNGEVGKIVSQALTLYIQMIQTQSLNSRFVQALSLLEYLAYPNEYKSFKDVKKVIAKYVAKDEEHRKYLYKRFQELTGKKDEITDKEVGLRTLIVHIGGNIENLLEYEDRKKLFIELDTYIRKIIDFMIFNSEMNYDDYFKNKLK
ncbi:hypothetical protein [Aliarcobacter cryaerophilus]|uniref:hypothetical protein n=1 Tax=Aliarcobacter cryaerophilus TaxID=28198 RepID=UPI003AF341D0